MRRVVYRQDLPSKVQILTAQVIELMKTWKINCICIRVENFTSVEIVGRYLLEKPDCNIYGQKISLMLIFKEAIFLIETFWSYNLDLDINQFQNILYL